MNKLHADHRTVFELQHGMLGRQVAYFERAKDAEAYARLINQANGEATPQNLQQELKDAQAKIEELRGKLKEGRRTLDQAVSDERRAYELAIGYEAKRNEANTRVAELEARIHNASAVNDEMNGRLADLLKAYEEVVTGNRALLQRAEQAEAALADRIEHCEKYHSGQSIVHTLTNQYGQAFAVYLSDGQKIGVQREGGAAWLQIEPTPIVREAGEGGKTE